MENPEHARHFPKRLIVERKVDGGDENGGEYFSAHRDPHDLTSGYHEDPVVVAVYERMSIFEISKVGGSVKEAYRE